MSETNCGQAMDAVSRLQTTNYDKPTKIKTSSLHMMTSVCL